MHQTYTYEEDVSNEFIYKKNLPLIWGRKWSIVASPSKEFFNKKRNVLPLAVFISFILFTIYIALYIHFMSKRTAAAQKMVEEKNQEINKANIQLELLSRLDGLTGIANRRCMDDFFEREWRLAIRNKTSLSFVIIDIDFFKLYNDTYGHQKGDECLKHISSILSQSMHRASDLVARYGGEEFIAILVNTDTNGAKKVAENIRYNIEALNIEHSSSKNAERVTVSLGKATVNSDYDGEPSLLIKQADDALYQSKENGRNCVTVSENWF